MRKNRIRIWFNRWFSTGTEFINLIKENDYEKQFEIYVTHHENRKDFINLADYFELEKKIYGREYIDYCIKFCIEHKIDVFFPKYRLKDISKYRKEFEDIGVKVLLAASDEIINLVENKGSFYEACRGHKIIDIPEYKIIKGLDEFESHYHKMKEKTNYLCFKPVISEGGLDFRVINDNELVHPNISFSKAKLLIDNHYKEREIMLMEYLDGIEYSIDCLAYKGELLVAIPRKKIGWKRILENNSTLIEIAKRITRVFDFSYVFNIQVIYKNGVPMLLEVNPRMSGGLGTSCLSGVNFPYCALELLLEGKTNFPEVKYGVTVDTNEKIQMSLLGMSEKEIIPIKDGGHN